VNRWTPKGPAADQTFKVCFDNATPAVLHAYTYAVTPGSGQTLYKSTNGGTTWDEGVSLPKDFPRYEVTPDPWSPGTLYAFDARLYKSSDGGKHWSLVPLPETPGTTAFSRSSRPVRRRSLSGNPAWFLSGRSWPQTGF